jgi:hypothetical protein
MLPNMRRVAAVLALIATSQSVVLGTGVLCGALASLDAPVGSASTMPGMDMDGAPAPNRPDQPAPDRHHGDAHCPLMATCGAAAVASLSITVSQPAFLIHSVLAVRSDAPSSERIAPEPPPPKS